MTINVPYIDSMKNAKLDINEGSLVFEYPSLFYLDLNLKYKCNPGKGSAKHDKAKKTLTIRVPITGLTEDSQRAFEENFKDFQARNKVRMDEITKPSADEGLRSEEAAKGEARAIIPDFDMPSEEHQ